MTRRDPALNGIEHAHNERVVNPSNLHNHHNVYILGAGFSTDAGLPAIAGFMSAMRDAARDDTNNRARKAISTVMEYRLNAAGAAYRCPIDPENIEELFSLVDAEEQHLPAAAEPQRQMRLAIAATINHAHQAYRKRSQIIRMNLGNTMYLTDVDVAAVPPGWTPNADNPSHHDVPLYDAYLAVMTGRLYQSVAGRRDTIMTFNYDTLVEDACVHLGIPYSYGFGEESYRSDKRHGGFVTYNPGRLPLLRRAIGQTSTVDLLKLHGSVNWKLCYEQSDTPKYHGESIPTLNIEPSFDELLAGYDDLDRLLIEPPTWRKGQGESGRMLAAVWEAALDALRTATRIIVMGYSLPLTDVHFRYLMAAGLRENISLKEIVFVNRALMREQPELGRLESRIFQVLRQELHDRGVIQFFGYPVRQALTPVGVGTTHGLDRSIFRKLNPSFPEYGPLPFMW